MHVENPKKFKEHFVLIHNPSFMIYFKGEQILKKAWHSDDVDDTHFLLLYNVMIKQENKFMKILQGEHELE